MIPRDAFHRIHELRSLNYGRNTIADYTGVSSAMVRHVLEGDTVALTDELSIRQRGNMLSNWPRVGV